LVQAQRREATVPDGSVATPLRAARMGRDHDRRPVLDHLRAQRRSWSGYLLRRVGDRLMSESSHRDNPTRVGDPALHGGESWEGTRVVVAGFGVSGYAAADTLNQLGADVLVLDDGEDEALREKAAVLQTLDVRVRLGPGSTAQLPSGTDLVVTSPGWTPRSPLLVQAREQGVDVWGEVELAWRLRTEGAAGWLVVTGTNGKTTVVQMLEAILRAAGLRAAAVGNVGRPVLEAVMDPEPYDVLAVELSSFQLHWCDTVSADAATVLNIAPDHLDWHGCAEAYRADKAKAFANARLACVYNADDPVTEQMVLDADVVEGCRAIGFTLGVPQVGMLGVVDGVLADRAFVDSRAT